MHPQDSDAEALTPRTRTLAQLIAAILGWADHYETAPIGNFGSEAVGRVIAPDSTKPWREECQNR